MSGLKAVKFDPDEIPTFKEMNSRLINLAGWQIVPVDGLIPTKDFFQLIAKKEFPVTTWIRPMDKLDYIQEPDLFHDVFGHVPQLANKPFCDFMEAVGKLAVKNIDSDEFITKLDRLWWFTVEFGLVRENGEVKIFGGGILSSKNEIAHALSDRPVRKEFEMNDVIAQPFHIDRLQDVFFVIESFEQLFDSIKSVAEGKT